MKAKTFRTDIKCMGCLTKVTPFLNETVGEDNWEVNINTPEKTLTVISEADETAIVGAVEKAGFKAEKAN